MVFDAGARPWIEIDAADPDDIAEVVMQCPTGALGFRRLDDGAQESLPVDHAGGTTAERTTVSARRAPDSAARRDGARHGPRRRCAAAAGRQNKPFCDGTHKVNGFEAD